MGKGLFASVVIYTWPTFYADPVESCWLVTRSHLDTHRIASSCVMCHFVSSCVMCHQVMTHSMNGSDVFSKSQKGGRACSPKYTVSTHPT